MLIHIFTRDLRIEDNNCLNFLHKKYPNEKIYCVFFLNPQQYKNNDYKNNHILRFMKECLIDLNKSLNNKLHIYEGDLKHNFELLIKELPDVQENIITIMEDYTPFHKKRVELLNNLLIKHNKNFKIQEIRDNVLLKPDKTYKRFTAFYNYEMNNIDFLDLKIKKYPDIKFGQFHRDKIDLDLDNYLPSDPKATVRGGREAVTEHVKLLLSSKFLHSTNKNLTKNEIYDKNMKLNESGSNLSPYIKFGCISIREAYHLFNKIIKSPIEENRMIRQLIWRDFYYQLYDTNPQLLENSEALKVEQDKNYHWVKNRALFEKVTNGKYDDKYKITINDVVKKLKETGQMNNRARLMFSSHFSRELHLDWRLGEKFFANNLIDYDPIINSGNWQYSVGVGADSRPPSQFLHLKLSFE
jgi:deoxyribodipyrimidine photo-lyase